MLFSIALSTFFSLLGQLGAATIEAKSVSLVDVRSAVATAKDGDAVIVPKGTATWTAPLDVTKNITLQGAGAGSTIIVDEVPRGSSHEAPGNDENSSEPPKQSGQGAAQGVEKTRPAKGSRRKLTSRDRRRSFLISIRLTKDLPFRMTGFAFKEGTVNTQKNFNGVIRISGNCHSFRVDHCKFDRLRGTSLAVSGFLWGVIDHNVFNCIASHPITVKHRNWNGKDWGHGSWADDPYWGSEKFVFIEDNTFEGGGGIDSFEGARFVVRHNHMHNCGLVMHGTEGQGRGAKQVEEYNNTYVFDRPDAAGQIRSGCIITHDNTWTNVNRGHVLQDFRYYVHGRWGTANGENVYDLNAPNGTIGYWATGTHTGADRVMTLEDNNPTKTWWDEAGAQQTGAWTTDRWWVPGAVYIVRNKTREGAGSWTQSWALSSNSDKITFSQMHFPGKPPLTFNKGDTYQIWKVARLLDQSGVGKGDLLTGGGIYGTSAAARPRAWPNQHSEPCYSWNNTQEGAARNLFSSQPSIKEGRDYFNGTPKPGYKPYAYPHPLVSGATPQKEKSGTADATQNSQRP